MKQHVSELTSGECATVVAALIERGYSDPPAGYPYEYLLSRLVRRGRLTMVEINSIIKNKSAA